MINIGLAFDLDGVIINSEKRYMKNFMDVLRDFRIDVDYDKIYGLFILRKKEKYTILDLFRLYLHNRPKLALKCYKMWLKNVELWKYLQYDMLEFGVKEKLNELYNEAILALITSRTNRYFLIKELCFFDIRKYFSFVLTRTGLENTKIPLLSVFKNATRLRNYFFITDSIKDIEEGKKLGFKTVGVNLKMLCKSKTDKYQPDLVINSISDLDINVLKTLV